MNVIVSIVLFSKMLTQIVISANLGHRSTTFKVLSFAFWQVLHTTFVVLVTALVTLDPRHCFSVAYCLGWIGRPVKKSWSRHQKSVELFIAIVLNCARMWVPISSLLIHIYLLLLGIYFAGSKSVMYFRLSHQIQ